MLRTFSSGGGWQSIAALVLSAQGRIDFPVHLFANVGDDSESPGTLDYVRNVAMPYAEAHGIEFHELRKQRRDGTQRTLLETLTRPKSRSLPIPVRVANGAPGTRTCTIEYKIKVLQRWHREHGATAADPAHVGIGFSSDELDRVSGRPRKPYEVAEYPLIDLGISRNGCAKIITDVGLPMPPKSACWFCPFHKPSTWREMRRDEPVQFGKAVELESLLNERRDMLGKDHIYFTRYARPLDQAIGEAQTALFPDQDGWGETCDEGSCFT